MKEFSVLSLDDDNSESAWIEDLKRTVAELAEQIATMRADLNLAKEGCEKDQAHIDRQAEQIAAARTLAERWQSVAADLDESKLTATISAVFGTQAGCGDAILKALGVSGE